MAIQEMMTDSIMSHMELIRIFYPESSEAKIRAMALENIQEEKKRKEEEIKHTFPYPGLPYEERAKELHEDKRFFEDILSNGPDEYAEQRLRETENELHKLYERGIGGFIAGSEHDQDRDRYLQKGEEEKKKDGQNEEGSNKH